MKKISNNKLDAFKIDNKIVKNIFGLDYCSFEKIKNLGIT